MTVDMDKLAELHYSDYDPEYSTDDDEENNDAYAKKEARNHLKRLMFSAFEKMDDDDLDYLDQKLDYQIYDFYKEWEKRK